MHIEALERRQLWSAGGLDASFGRRGVRITGLPADVDFQARAAQPDGKAVLCGYTYDPSGTSGRNLVVARLNADGSVDTTFGTNGLTVTDLPPNLPTQDAPTEDEANAVAIDPAGRIVVAGSVTPDIHDEHNLLSRPFVARFTPAGQLDPTFGATGPAADVIAPGVIELSFYAGQSPGGTAESLLVQPSGEIVVGGSAGGYGAGNTYLLDPAYAVEWLTPDGVPDGVHGGVGTYSLNVYPTAVTFGPDTGVDLFLSDVTGQEASVLLAPQADGGFVLAGQGSDGNTAPFAFVAFDATGAASALHYVNPSVFSDWAAEFPTALAVQPDGKLVLAGGLLGRFRNPSRGAGLILRLDPTGTTLDPTFGSGGAVLVQDGPVATATSVAFAADGGIAVGLQVSVGVTALAQSRVRPGIAWLTADGQPEPAFGRDGVLTVPAVPATAAIPGAASTNFIQDLPVTLVSVDADGRATATFEVDGAVYDARTPAEPADVAAGPVTAAPARAGRPIVVRLTVTDADLSATTGPATVRLTATPSVGGEAVMTDVSVALVLPGKGSEHLKLSFALLAGLAAGKYTLTAQVLPSTGLGDVDPTDDTATGTVTVR